MKMQMCACMKDDKKIKKETKSHFESFFGCLCCVSNELSLSRYEGCPRNNEPYKEGTALES